VKIWQTTIERKCSNMNFRLKSVILILMFVCCVGYLPLMAQGELEFSATINNPIFGAPDSHGTFTLVDGVFTYDVDMVFGFSLAEIRGPGPALDAPVVLALNLTRCEIPSPQPGSLGGCFFDGTQILSSDQIDDLVAGELWVWARSPTNPDNPMFGPIVPEPSPHLFILIIAVCMTTGFICRKIGDHAKTF